MSGQFLGENQWGENEEVFYPLLRAQGSDETGQHARYCSWDSSKEHTQIVRRTLDSVIAMHDLAPQTGSRFILFYVVPTMLLLAGALLPVIVGVETLYTRDVFGVHLEMKAFQAEAMRSGYMPLIDPYRAGGQPHLGNLNTVPLYPDNLLILSLYLAINFLYTNGLKSVVILDVMIIALGFVLRVVGGGVAVRVEVSAWLLLCTSFLSLLLAFSKRRHELVLLSDEASSQRQVLSHYNVKFLDQMINVVTASTVVCYAVYAISPETVQRFNSRYLILTMPFVLFGIFRYLYLVYQKSDTANPTEAILRDGPFLANLTLWGIAVLWIVYGL